MKYIVIFTLLLVLVLGVLLSICLYGYIKELKNLPWQSFVKGSEDEECKDYIYYIIFFASILLNIFILSSCIISFNF